MYSSINTYMSGTVLCAGDSLCAFHIEYHIVRREREREVGCVRDRQTFEVAEFFPLDFSQTTCALL